MCRSDTLQTTPLGFERWGSNVGVRNLEGTLVWQWPGWRFFEVLAGLAAGGLDVRVGAVLLALLGLKRPAPGHTVEAILGGEVREGRVGGGAGCGCGRRGDRPGSGERGAGAAGHGEAAQKPEGAGAAESHGGRGAGGCGV